MSMSRSRPRRPRPSRADGTVDAARLAMSVLREKSGPVGRSTAARPTAARPASAGLAPLPRRRLPRAIG